MKYKIIEELNKRGIVTSKKEVLNKIEELYDKVESTELTSEIYLNTLIELMEISINIDERM